MDDVAASIADQAARGDGRSRLSAFVDSHATWNEPELVLEASMHTLDALLADPRLILFRTLRLELAGVILKFWTEGKPR